MAFITAKIRFITVSIDHTVKLFQRLAIQKLTIG